MITLIIPAYNAHSTIETAIASVVIQTVVDKINIIIADDHSERTYDDIVQKFSNLVKIRAIRHEKNLGVSYARQTGLDAVDTPYFAFMDSDDVFLNALVFEKMLTHMERTPECILLSGSFLEQRETLDYELKDKSMYWTFSKLYRTSYVRKNNISFPPQNQNEDNIFNMTIKMCLKDNESIQNTQEPMYIWKYKPDSITRNNNHEYWFHMDVVGVIRGLYHILENPNINREIYINDAINFFFIGYFRYHDSKFLRPNEEWHKKILKETRRLYEQVIKPFEFKLTDEIITERMALVVKEHQKELQDIKKFKDFMKNYIEVI
jgi:glycosyltransferase involved in cell wall biosynthesis